MKILVATGIFPPQIGGPATYAKLIYDELPRYDIDVEIANFGDFIGKPKIIRHFLYFLELFKKCSEDIDLILALDPVSVGLPALFASQLRGKKLIVKVVGDYAWEQGAQRFNVKENLDQFVGDYKKYPWQVRLLKKIQTYVVSGATSVITPSKYLKSILVDWGIDSHKISVIYNGFHMEPVKETPSVLRKHLKWNGKIIITVGRLVPWKGIQPLIDIMPEILKIVPDARLIIVGDGPDGDALKKQVASLSLDDAINFAGRLDQKTLFQYVKAADLFVLNTAYEGFSHQIIETMALGTPVITTAVGGNVEVVRNTENGVLVPFGALQSLREAITDLLIDTKKAENMAKIAKKDVTRFTDEIMLQRLAENLKTVIKNK